MIVEKVNSMYANVSLTDDDLQMLQMAIDNYTSNPQIVGERFAAAQTMGDLLCCAQEKLRRKRRRKEADT